MNPLDVLRHYVTGAVERGEKLPLVEVRPAEAVAEDVARVFHSTWGDIAPLLTCSEAEALAGLFRALGQNEAAADILACHAEGDNDPDDLHYAPETGL